jgi:SM-20-related protein
MEHKLVNTMMDDRAQTAVAFELNPTLDQVKLSADFEKKRRLRVPDFLRPAGALALYKHLEQYVGWQPFLVSEGKLLTAAPDVHGSYPIDLHRIMCDRAYEGARRGFASLYEADRLFPEDLPQGLLQNDHADSSLLAHFSHFLNSAEALNLIRGVTRKSEIQRVEIQATRHRRNHFSTFRALMPPTQSSETVFAAFTITLNLEWMPEWGGLLEFQSHEGYVVEAYVPSFNVIDIFSLPQGHWISPVAPFAAGMRMAISGRLYVP